MWRPDFAKPVPSDPVAHQPAPEAEVHPSGFSGSEYSAPKRESDFAELAAKLAAHGDGKIPPELSGELALDIVLNEIVEEACLATGASGAAIALARGEEMVCRATSGGDAPELGTRLDMNAGLSGACVRTRQIQSCDDALADPSVDAEVSRELGVRSVVVLPLLRDDALIGIFEIFSSLPGAFSNGDLRTLEVLAGRILRNTEARQSSLIPIKLPPLVVEERGGDAREVQGKDATSVSSEEEAAVNAPVMTQLSTRPAASRFEWLTTLMGGVLVVVALLMVTVFAMRMGWLKGGGQHRAHGAGPAAPVSPVASSKARQADVNAGGQSLGSNSSAMSQNKSTVVQTKSTAESAAVPEGGLRVYENGKEIFRMPPAETNGAGMPPAEPSAKASSELESAKIVELPPDAAEGSVIRRVEPEYPEQALAHHIQGLVQLDVHISEDGAVQDASLASGDPLLAEAAIAAVRQWRFKPRIVNGRPVEMETKITLKFTLPSN
jgi:TonB family protein